MKTGYAFFHWLKLVWRSEEGLAYMEFALSVGVLLVLFIGSVEVTRFALITQKLEKVASTVADVTTQANPNSSPLTTTVMSQLMSAVQDMMNPYTFGTNGDVIVSDVTQSGASNPVLNWQYCGGGTLTATSRVGTTIGGAVTLPNGFTMIAGEEVVISEVFYSYTPVFSSQHFFVASTLYKTAVYMPRLGALTAFSSHC